MERNDRNGPAGRVELVAELAREDQRCRRKPSIFPGLKGKRLSRSRSGRSREVRRDANPARPANPANPDTQVLARSDPAKIIPAGRRYESRRQIPGHRECEGWEAGIWAERRSPHVGASTTRLATSGAARRCASKPWRPSRCAGRATAGARCMSRTGRTLASASGTSTCRPALYRLAPRSNSLSTGPRPIAGKGRIFRWRSPRRSFGEHSPRIAVTTARRHEALHASRNTCGWPPRPRRG